MLLVICQPAVEHMEPQSKRETPALHCKCKRHSPSERDGVEGDNSMSFALSTWHCMGLVMEGWEGGHLLQTWSWLLPLQTGRGSGAHLQPTQASWVAYYGSGGEKGLDWLLGAVKPWHIAISLLNMSVRRMNLTLLSLQPSTKWKTETGEGVFFPPLVL